MKPIFTVHAGEFLVADYIEKHFPNVNLWVPSRDRGVDLLVTDSHNLRAVSLQVKFSRDFLSTHIPEKEFHNYFCACGWFTLNYQKIKESKADYWVLVIMSPVRSRVEYIIIEPSKLSARLKSIHPCDKTVQCYLWVARNGECWETRGLKKLEKQRITQGAFKVGKRNFSNFRNSWGAVEALS